MYTFATHFRGFFAKSPHAFGLGSNDCQIKQGHALEKKFYHSNTENEYRTFFNLDKKVISNQIRNFRL